MGKHLDQDSAETKLDDLKKVENYQSFKEFENVGNFRIAWKICDNANCFYAENFYTFLMSGNV